MRDLSSIGGIGNHHYLAEVAGGSGKRGNRTLWGETHLQWNGTGCREDGEREKASEKHFDGRCFGFHDHRPAEENGCDVPDMNPINTVIQHALRLCDEAAAAERPTCFKVKPSSYWANELKHVDTIYDRLTKEEIAEWREAFELFSAPEGRRSALEHWLKHELQDTAWMLDGAVGQALLRQAEAEADSRHAPTQLGRSLLIIHARRQAKRAPAGAASADYEHTGVSVQYPGSESCHSAYPWGLPRPPAILCCDRLLAPRFRRGG